MLGVLAVVLLIIFMIVYFSKKDRDEKIFYTIVGLGAFGVFCVIWDMFRLFMTGNFTWSRFLTLLFLPISFASIFMYLYVQDDDSKMKMLWMIGMIVSCSLFVLFFLWDRYKTYSMRLLYTRLHKSGVYFDSRQKYLFAAAIARNDHERLDRLIQEHGVNTFSPLAIAVGMGNVEMVDYLLRHHHADPSFGDFTQRTPLWFVNENAEPILKLLLEFGADINMVLSGDNFVSESPIYHAAQTGRLDALIAMLDVDGVNAGWTSDTGKNLLFVLADNLDTPPDTQDLEKIKLIVGKAVEKGADINRKDLDGNTPLTYNAYLPEYARILVKYGANPKLTGKDDRNAIDELLTRLWDKEDVEDTYFDPIDKLASLGVPLNREEAMANITSYIDREIQQYIERERRDLPGASDERISEIFDISRIENLLRDQDDEEDNVLDWYWATKKRASFLKMLNAYLDQLMKRKEVAKRGYTKMAAQLDSSAPPGLVERGYTERIAINPSTLRNISSFLQFGRRRGQNKQFKYPRKWSEGYCKKTKCADMGFSQKASCRPFKNCYK